MNTHTDTLAKGSQNAIDKAHDIATQVSNKANQAISTKQSRVADAEQSIQHGLKQIGEAVPATLSRAATQAEDLARAGIDRARAAGQSLTQQASHMREQTVSYVREEPTKAILMAVAAGAFATLLIGWATRGNGNSRH